MKHIEIHETAFVTSTFRSYNESLSKDYFAKLWNNPKAEAWAQEYLKKVSSEETATHCLRNRYFYDKINELVENNNIEVVINFGCGFSMYPFLLNETLTHIEVDKPEIIKYKKAKINKWQKENLLSKRNIHFIGVDFSKNYQDELRAKIYSIKANKSCFVLLEGVLFFLSRFETENLFNFFNIFQKSGDFIGSVSFQNAIKKTIAFKKLILFIDEKITKTNANDFQTISNEYYKKRKGYRLVEHQDYFSLSKTYQNIIKLERELILNENFYLLEKINP